MWPPGKLPYGCLGSTMWLWMDYFSLHAQRLQIPRGNMQEKGHLRSSQTSDPEMCCNVNGWIHKTSTDDVRTGESILSRLSAASSLPLANRSSHWGWPRLPHIQCNPRGLSVCYITYSFHPHQPYIWFPVIICLVIRLSARSYKTLEEISSFRVNMKYLFIYHTSTSTNDQTNTHFFILWVFYLVNSPEGPGAENLDPFEFCLFQDSKLGLVGCCPTRC